MIPCIYIDPLSDFLLTNLKVPLTTRLAELPKRLAEVERVVVDNGSLLNQLLLIVQADFQLVLAQNCVVSHCEEVASCSMVAEDKSKCGTRRSRACLSIRIVT